MKFRILLLAFCLVLAAFPVLAEEEPAAPAAPKAVALTPEFLRNSCYNYGAVKTVRQLTATGGTLWSELMDHIADGDPDWIGYVPLFASGTDAGYATQLTIALAKALPKNPQAVLSLEYAFVSLRNVCSLPFFDPDEEFIRSYTRSVTQAMQAITDPYMQMDKQICLTRLKNAAELVQKRHQAQ